MVQILDGCAFVRATASFVLFPVVGTQVFYLALVAEGFMSFADVSSVEYEPMMCTGYVLLGQVFHEPFLDTQWGGAALGYEAYAMAHTEDMGVDGHGGFAVDDALYDIGCLATDAWQSGQFVEGGWHLTVEVGDEHLGHADEMACLAVGVGDSVDEILKLFERGLCHCFGRWIGLEEGGGDLIHFLVGALGAEDDGD